MKNKQRVLSQADLDKMSRLDYTVSFKDTILENIVFPRNIRYMDFRNAILKNVDFSNRILSRSDFTGAKIYHCNFTHAFMIYSDFRSSMIKCSDFSEAALRGSTFAKSLIANSKFVKSDLYNTDLDQASYYDRFLASLNDFTDAMYFQRVPTEGSFVGWKEGVIITSDQGNFVPFLVKLLIPEDAKRTSAFGIKCRCNKAIVLDIFNIDGSPTDVKAVHSIYSDNFVYEKGKTVEEPYFDDRWWQECSDGIHFFLDKRAAMLYTAENL